MKELKYHDISPLISPRIAVYPEDVNFERKVSLSFENGNHLELSSITATVHLGAHADAPSHYKKSLDGIDKRDLGFYFGPCQVIEVKNIRGERVSVADISVPIKHPRVLLKTGSFPNPEKWNDDFNSYSPEAIKYLHDKGVRLVGIDTPSVDPANSKKLESHQMIAQYDMAVLEGLVLSNVTPGEYFLCALPLRLEGCEASPVRAVLFESLVAFNKND